MLEQALLFTACSNIQFFNSPPFPRQSQLGHAWYPTPQCVQPLYNFWAAIPGDWSPSGSYSTLPREADDFPRSGKYSKDVSLPTFLAYLQPA